jgi:hypothetical protein
LEGWVYSVGYRKPKMEIAADVASDLPRKLGLIDALAIVIGMVIGGGIFLVPNLVTRVTADPLWSDVRPDAISNNASIYRDRSRIVAGQGL